MSYTPEQIRAALQKGSTLLDRLTLKYGEANARRLCGHKLLVGSGAYFTEDLVTLESLADKLAIFNDIKRL